MSQRVVGSRSKSRFLSPLPERAVEWPVPHSDRIEIAAADQVVTVDAGVPICELQRQLSKNSLCLPLPSTERHGTLVSGFPGTVGGLIAMNMPHGLAAQYGEPREWLLHAEFWFRSEVARSGAKVVKSVAGYDVHKVLVGSRGLLGPISQVTFRTWPIRALDECESEQTNSYSGENVWILRTLPSQFQAALEKSQAIFAIDRPSCTLWSGVRPNLPSEGWLIGPGGEVWRDNESVGLEQNLKEAFDPKGEWV